MSCDAFLNRWIERLRQPLPGHDVQRQFEPELAFGRHAGPAPTSARPAAVMCLLYPHEETWHLPLTLRPAVFTTHSGQVSLPGGAVEPGESSGAAALRELEEELGVPPSEVTLLGRLTDLYLFTTNFLIVPWVAAARTRPAFRPDAREVAELLEVPLSWLSEPNARETHLLQRSGVAFQSPGFVWHEHFIWGATSMILAELVALNERLCR